MATTAPVLTPGKDTTEYKIAGGTGLVGLVLTVISWAVGNRWHLNVGPVELYALGSALSAGLYAISRGIAKNGHAKETAAWIESTAKTVEATIPQSVRDELETVIEENIFNTLDKHLPKQIADQVDAVIQEYFPEEEQSAPEPAADSGGADAPLPAPPTAPPPVVDPAPEEYDYSQIPGVEIVQ